MENVVWLLYPVNLTKSEVEIVLVIKLILYHKIFLQKFEEILKHQKNL